uniref:Carbonic anhydrase n=1 Tax=Phlebotomus papatasi TaxID=29031 RepID=A0A1B0EZU9_PHLPP
MTLSNTVILEVDGHEYIPRDIHFHWGRNDTQGSEHSINSRKYSLEMHIVCYNSKYGSVAEAKFFKDGILVIESVEVGVKLFWKRKLCAFNLGEFLNVDALRKGSFVVYNGSFTTPPCYEDVTWVIPLKVNSIDKRKMNFFREIQGLDGRLVDNYRPIQPINTRKCLVG